MTVLPWQPGQTPYVTPDQLYSTAGSGGVSQWPVGVQWGTIMGQPNVPYAQLFSVLASICGEGTVRAEEIANQPLRATISAEELQGPDFRVTYQEHTGNGRIIASRWPVLSVSSVEVAPNAVWPRSWTSLPAGTFEPEYPVQSLYGTTVGSGAGGAGQAILFAPGYMNRCLGRQGWRVRVTYLAGWPHTCLTAAALAGDGTLTVDDCTGWTGAAGIIYDALGGGQETFSCTATSVTAGPGTLTLAANIAYAHGAGIMTSAMPQTGIWATAQLAGATALTRGATATTIQTTGGRRQSSTPDLLDDLAKKRLRALMRTI
ncbi:MAG TPA: hypothetical protein VMV92_12640 [Streptosporangiaceae bacterium]|nr:hypothetical protein [Streptosporangiaceae bacterium]